MSELDVSFPEKAAKKSLEREEVISRYVQYLSVLVRSKIQAGLQPGSEEQLRVLFAQAPGQPHERGWRELDEPSLENREARTRLFAELRAKSYALEGLTVRRYDETLAQFIQSTDLGNGYAIKERTDYAASGGKLDAVFSELFLVRQQD